MKTSTSTRVLNTVGRRIAAARRTAGLTQEELADRLGWPRDTLIHYEHGRRSLSVDRLVAIAEAIDHHPAALLIDDEVLATVTKRLARDPHLLSQVTFFLDTLEAD